MHMQWLHTFDGWWFCGSYNVLSWFNLSFVCRLQACESCPCARVPWCNPPSLAQALSYVARLSFYQSRLPNVNTIATSATEQQVNSAKTPSKSLGARNSITFVMLCSSRLLSRYLRELFYQQGRFSPHCVRHIQDIQAHMQPIPACGLSQDGLARIQAFLSCYSLSRLNGLGIESA